MAKNINVVIPMAGRGSRFFGELPKPLIKVGNHPMIYHAIDSLGIDGNYIYITRKYEDSSLNEYLNKTLKELTPDCEIIEIDYITEGPASSVLLAKQFINTDAPLVVANCDQIMNWDANDFLTYSLEGRYDGVVVTYNASTKNNSYIQLDQNGIAIKLAEKEVISEHSLNGIHFWREGRLAISSIERMISNNIRHNNEFYISLSYNELIKQNYIITNYKLGNMQHFPVGIPSDLQNYKNLVKIIWKYIN